MASDSVANASSIPIASSNPKDFAKRKRANRSAKLKQCKLDARREQWLSQVRNKGNKGEANGGGTLGEPMHVVKERGRPMEKLEIKPRGGGENDGSMNNYSDSESASNSPTSHTSSIMGSNDSGMNFSGSSSSSTSSSRCGSSSTGCCSGSMSEEGEEYDDWEAVADALAATDNKYKENDPGSDLHQESIENVPGLDSKLESDNQQGSVNNVSESKKNNGVAVPTASEANFRAWRPDDTCRPSSLPNLSKQYSFPIKSDRHFGLGGSVWGRNVAPIPTSCPICYEDLDYTDTSFLPCSCGFRLCLFCYNRILEDDGRCPSCRKQYDYNPNPVNGEATFDGGSLTFRLARSCSLVTRS